VNRSKALQKEVTFWRNWLKTQGASWPQDFINRFDVNMPIQNYLVPYIDEVNSDPVRILDVGSGPVTKLGKIHRSKRLSITATDILAKEYDILLDELRIIPLIRTIYADAEKLAERFGEKTYDIVHGQNCIDHTADPFRAIEQMLAVTKPRGFVVLCHAENEGEKESYRQLHQWDFGCEAEVFVIRDRNGTKFNMTKRLMEWAEVGCTRVRDGNDFAIVTGIHKKA
jgi:SAM-dependent methyltransferase